MSWRFSHSVSLDESFLSDIDAYLATHNKVQLAAAHNYAEDDSDDTMGVPMCNTKKWHILRLRRRLILFWSPHPTAGIDRKCVHLLLEDNLGQTPIHRDWQAGEQEQLTKDSQETRTPYPRKVFRQVANSMNGQHNELSVTLCTHYVESCYQAAEAALGDIDESLLLMPRGTNNHRSLRKTALVSFRITLGKRFVLLNSNKRRQ